MQETLMRWQPPSGTHPVATRRHPMVSSLTLQLRRRRVLCLTVPVNCNLIHLLWFQWSPCIRASQWLELVEESKPRKETASISRLFTTTAQVIYSSVVVETCQWLSRWMVPAVPSTNSSNKMWSRHIRLPSSDLLIRKRSEACTETLRFSSISLVTRTRGSELKQNKWMLTFRRKRKKLSSSLALSSSNPPYCILVVAIFPSLRRPITLSHS